ncbi:translation initiation factor IF-2 [Peptoanaerobacter stomatis]|uniref:Translation initiation factor IF-2 n=1 Tax=Peptoanaerobacter stomatis TaxID=796937 RepID=G9XA15_9FIRM|nr:translation initiation factor IF-2 [Peptoanaerobacter stomatis]EHL20261.1 translation initiation factor IF-2 [Peptoanaerobacter stomatis]
MVVGEFATLIGVPPTQVIMSLMKMGIMANINQNIKFETAEKIAFEFDKLVELKEPEEEKEDIIIQEDSEEDLELRPPIVTVMGHVDHGKTSLLDAIRKTKVTDKEAGGITQHIGASEVYINGKKVVFLDTPGHEAFTQMRLRGAQVTDIAILVVAADDGIMPQTIEAISHAKAADIPIIVAINKIDKPTANIEKVRQELSNNGLLVEDWGGDIIDVPVSAKKGQNLDKLLEMVLLVAEMEELKANPNRPAVGTVIESNLDKGRGPVATVIVSNGTLKVGDPVIAGTAYGKIRALVNDKGQRVKKATPSTPVEILGLNEVPMAGDQFVVMPSEKAARTIGEKRRIKQRDEQMKATSKITLEDLFDKMQEGEVKELDIVLKADVQGSLEAIRQSIEKISNEQVQLKVIHSGVGAVADSDIMLASASNAIVIGFNVRPTSSAIAMAEREQVDMRTYRIIYELIEDIEKAMKGMLDPEYKEVVIGQAEVRETFKVSGVGTIAGSYVTEGKVTRSSKARLVRNGIVIYDGEVASIRRFKDDVKEVARGYECGITLANFNDIKEQDIIEAYEMQEIER